jgi:hypothetical protein
VAYGFDEHVHAKDTVAHSVIPAEVGVGTAVKGARESHDVGLLRRHGLNDPEWLVGADQEEPAHGHIHHSVIDDDPAAVDAQNLGQASRPMRPSLPNPMHTGQVHCNKEESKHGGQYAQPSATPRRAMPLGRSPVDARCPSTHRPASCGRGGPGSSLRRHARPAVRPFRISLTLRRPSSEK